MDTIREEIFENLIQVKRISQEVNYSVLNDKSSIWEKQMHNLLRLRKLLDDTISLDRQKFSAFSGKIGSYNTALREDRDSQIAEIKKWGIEGWLGRFWILIRDFSGFVFYNYLYYFTYDSLSENSRDNESKARIVASLAGPHHALLEIGPGTGPLLRRLLGRGYDVHAIEMDALMIHELLQRCPQARERVIHADFFHYALGNNKYDLIFIESGIFMFTRLGRNKIVFEQSGEVSRDRLILGLKKILSALKRDGKMLIGIQGLMKKVRIHNGYYFYLKRTQGTDRAVREAAFYRKKSPFSMKEQLYVHRDEKPTIAFEDFKELAGSIGFTDISILGYEWVVLRK